MKRRAARLSCGYLTGKADSETGSLAPEWRSRHRVILPLVLWASQSYIRALPDNLEFRLH
jgi:hypothetical protein